MVHTENTYLCGLSHKHKTDGRQRAAERTNITPTPPPSAELLSAR